MGTLAASYRTHRQALIDADNAVMALLFGAHFSATSLELAEGSSALLGRVYPKVPHIARFNLRPDAARVRLLDSEKHLARIAIPYALSVHEDYLAQVRSELTKAGVRIKLSGRSWNAEHMHDILFDTLSIATRPDLTEFDLFRRVRNVIIHQAGTVDDYLRGGVQNLEAVPAAASHWQTVTERPPAELIAEPSVAVGTGEAILAFSVVRHLSELVHDAVLLKVPREIWLDECVSTFNLEYAERIRRKQLLRTRLTTWASTYYDDFAFTWAELRKASADAGIPSHQLLHAGER